MILKNHFDTIGNKQARTKQTGKSALACLSLILLFTCIASAQIISGKVSDTQKSPVQNAQVFLKSNSKQIAQTETDTEGKFLLNGQNAPNLTLLIRAQGFADFSENISPNFNKSFEIILQPESLREDVTVSITRTESRLSETPASIVVLDEEDLSVTAAQAVDDILRQTAGFTLFRRSSSKTANPTTQGANLRGLAGSGASRTTVLFDGLSLNDAFGGWTYWSRVPQIVVAQAEILRGGASAFYGDAGLGGAVNLRSKSFAKKPILNFQASAGTQKTFDASLFAAYGKRGWNFSAALESFQTQGYIPTAENERGIIDTNARSRHNNALLTIERKFAESNRIFIRGNLFGERRDNGTSLTNNRTYFRQIAVGADYSPENIGTLQLRGFAEKQIYDQTFSAISNNRNTETLSRIQRVPSQAFGTNLFWTRAFGAKHFVSSSAELSIVKGFSDEIIFVNNRAATAVGSGGTRQTFSVFAQDIWRVSEKLNFNFGGRFDFIKNSDALSVSRNLTTNQTTAIVFADRRENAFSPRIAALYQINRNFSAVASFSKSFRAPTLNELYRAFRVGNVLTSANENLKSERASTFETGLIFSGLKRKLNVRGNLFFTEISQPVVSVTLTSTPNLITRQRQNVGKTLTRGFEIDGEYVYSAKLKFSGSFLFTDSRITDFPANPILIDKFLPQVARRQLTFQTVYRPLSKLTFSMQSRFSAAQFEDDLNTLRLRPFAVFDFFTSYKFKKIEVFAAAENIFDNRYDIGLTPNRTIAAPRFLRLGLRFNIND